MAVLLLSLPAAKTSLEHRSYRTHSIDQKERRRSFKDESFNSQVDLANALNRTKDWLQTCLRDADCDPLRLVGRLDLPSSTINAGSSKSAYHGSTFGWDDCTARRAAGPAWADGIRPCCC